ncbi:MAG: hypothetical protein ACRDZM_14780 [Acidimicrobiia bacterium]
MSDRAEEFADRIFASALGAIEIYSIHVGDRLGLYRALARSLPPGHTVIPMTDWGAVAPTSERS